MVYACACNTQNTTLSEITSPFLKNATTTPFIGSTTVYF